MSTSVKTAGRVVTALAVIKWVAVAAWIIFGVVGVLVIAAASSWPKWTLWLEVPVITAALIGAALSWVSIGWRQQMLGMLVDGNSRLGYIQLDASRIREYGVKSNGERVG